MGTFLVVAEMFDLIRKRDLLAYVMEKFSFRYSSMQVLTDLVRNLPLSMWWLCFLCVASSPVD